MNPETLHAIWRSGAVHRWHHSKHHVLRTSGDTVAAHSARVAILFECLSDGSEAERDCYFVAALLHDAPESTYGDTGRMAKQESNALARQLRVLDANWHHRHGTMWLPYEDPLLKLCDSLDAILWVASLAPYILAEQDWQDHIAEVERASWAISADVAAKVTGLLQAGGVR
jgi:5'-deoxynucleotidase YfbR-like HD superfamily hydrolase